MRFFKQSVLALTVAGLSIGAFADNATNASLNIGLTAKIEDLIRVDLSDYSVTIQQDDVKDWNAYINADVSRRGASTENEMSFGIEVVGLASGNGQDFWLNSGQAGLAQSMDEQRIAMRIMYENRPDRNARISPLLESGNKFEHGKQVEMRTQTCVSEKTRNENYNVAMRFRIPEEYIRNSVPGEYSTTLTFLVTAL